MINFVYQIYGMNTNTMFGNVTGNDALSSPGYPQGITRLSSDRAARIKELAQKASQTFPPPFKDEPQKENILQLEHTPHESRRIASLVLELGQEAVKIRASALVDSGSTGAISPGYPSMDELEKELGGVDGFFTLFGCHYAGMFSNPRMHILFDTRDKEDSESSALDHGKRIASTLLDLWYNTNYFSSLGRGFSGAFKVVSTHEKAKNCPMRPSSQQTKLPKGAGHRANKRFTVKQRDSWLGHVILAADQCGTSKEFQTKLGSWLAMTVSAYAPFYNEETGKLDWMEETPYGNQS